MEMIFGGFLALADDVSAQLFNVLLSALTAGALFLMGRKAFAGGGPRWELLLFVTAPCALLLSSETYVEAPMAFATTLAVGAGARALRSGDRRWWAAAGFLGGFCAGVKYTGVLTPALLAVTALGWPRPRAFKDRAADAAAVGLLSFLLFLPWLIKNFVLTGGNPVFPFLPSFFPAKNVYLPEASAGAYFQVLDEYRGSSNLLFELFLMPFRLATNAASFGGGYDVTGDLGWARSSGRRCGPCCAFCSRSSRRSACWRARGSPGW
jgi:4-amino-4-deoxy-L-arabinose transferase-like glycosyltransferase